MAWCGRSGAAGGRGAAAVRESSGRRRWQRGEGRTAPHAQCAGAGCPFSLCPLGCCALQGGRRHHRRREAAHHRLCRPRLDAQRQPAACARGLGRLHGSTCGARWRRGIELLAVVNGSEIRVLRSWAAGVWGPIVARARSFRPPPDQTGIASFRMAASPAAFTPAALPSPAPQTSCVQPGLRTDQPPARTHAAPQGDELLCLRFLCSAAESLPLRQTASPQPQPLLLRFLRRDGPGQSSKPPCSSRPPSSRLSRRAAADPLACCPGCRIPRGLPLVLLSSSRASRALEGSTWCTWLRQGSTQGPPHVASTGLLKQSATCVDSEEASGPPRQPAHKAAHKCHSRVT